MWASRPVKGGHWSLIKALVNPFLRAWFGHVIVSVVDKEERFIKYEIRRWPLNCGVKHGYENCRAPSLRYDGLTNKEYAKIWARNIVKGAKWSN